jgi:hypothetical protein
METAAAPEVSIFAPETEDAKPPEDTPPGEAILP